MLLGILLSPQIKPPCCCNSCQAKCLNLVMNLMLVLQMVHMVVGAHESLEKLLTLALSGNSQSM